MRIVQSALFLTVLFVSSQPFAAAGVLDKFKNKEGQRQQAEANVNADQYEMDASTGTVRKLPAEEQEQLKDLSCDSQMAKSLVKANDDLLQAQNERDAALQAKADAEQQIEALEKALAAKKEAMKAKVDDLNEKLVMSSNKAMNQMKDMSKAHDATIKDYERRLRATAQEYEEKLTATVSSSGDQVKELIAEKNAELVALKTETDATIASLQATIDDFQTTAEAEKKQIAGESQKKVDDLQQQMKKVQSEKSALEASKKDSEKKVQQMSEELAAWEAKFETRSYCNVTHIQEDIKAAAYSASEATKKKVTQVSIQAGEKARELSKEGVKAAKAGFEKSKLLAADGMEKARPAYEQTVKPHVDKVKTAAAPHIEKVRVATAPHVEKITTVSKPYVEKATVVAKQVNEKHVIPMYHKAKAESVNGANLAKKKVIAAYETLVSEYATSCPKALKEIRKISQEKNIQIPASIVDGMNASCKDARGSVNTVLAVFGVILFLIFRRRIFALVMALVKLPFRIVLFPFRWLLGGSKKTAVAPSAVANGNGQPSKKANKKLSNGKAERNGVHTHSQ